jgi:hypothetical protein
MRCGHTFKSNPDAKQPSCSKCRSSNLILAKELPERMTNKTKLKELEEELKEFKVEIKKDIDNITRDIGKIIQRMKEYEK